MVSANLLVVALWARPIGRGIRLRLLFPFRQVLLTGKLELPGQMGTLYGFLFFWWAAFLLAAGLGCTHEPEGGLSFFASFLGLAAFLVLQETLVLGSGVVYGRPELVQEGARLKRGLLLASGPWLALMSFLTLYLQAAGQLFVWLGWVFLLICFGFGWFGVLRFYARKLYAQEPAYFFYLCTLEIVPVMLAFAWMARSF